MPRRNTGFLYPENNDFVISISSRNIQREEIEIDRWGTQRHPTTYIPRPNVVITQAYALCHKVQLIRPIIDNRFANYPFQSIMIKDIPPEVFSKIIENFGFLPLISSITRIDFNTFNTYVPSAYYFNSDSLKDYWRRHVEKRFIHQFAGLP